MSGSHGKLSNDHDNFFEATHPLNLLNNLNELRTYGKLLDVTLVVENVRFQVHRIVMAASSNYFRAMFTDAMKEKAQSEITLKGITAVGLEIVINYFYTSRLQLHRNNVQDILLAATYFQIDPVIKACESFLQNLIDLENCVDILNTAQLYSLDKLKEEVCKYMCSNLSVFSESDEINRMNLEQFFYLLNSDYPVDCPEAIVLQIVIKWCLHQNADTVSMQKLLSKIHTKEISYMELEDILKMFRLYSNMNQKLYSVLSNAFEDYLPNFNTNKCRKNILPQIIKFTPKQVLKNSRGMELAVIKIGGFGANGITNKITYYLPSRKKWHNLTVIPHVDQSSYGTTVLGNYLYVVGGCYDVCLKEYIHPFGFRYCPIRNKWNTIAPMLNDRCRFSLNALGSYLYAIGGVSENNDENNENLLQENLSSNCERYNTQTDVWEYIEKLPENRTQHAGAVLNEYLYISGGLDRCGIFSSFWCFDTYTDRWKKLPPMLTQRADHTMLAINNKIYVCGGWFEDTVAETRKLVRTIDVYDISQKVWRIETEIPVPKYHAGIIAVNNIIYIIGGFNSDSIFDRASSSIQCFNIESKEWSCIDGYPENVWECSCVSLFVPRCRNDSEVKCFENE